jgi:peroxiredoxin
MAQRRLDMLITSVITLFSLFAPSMPGEQPGAAVLTSVEQGDAAPDFEFTRLLPNGTTETARLRDLRGKNVMIAFYPKAFSEGCTRQLDYFERMRERMERNGFELIAISGDRQGTATRFREMQGYGFSVVGDAGLMIIPRYAVPMRRYLGIDYAQRSVFLVDAEGIVQYVDRDYAVFGEQEPLWSAMEELGRDVACRRAEAECTLSDPAVGVRSQ